MWNGATTLHEGDGMLHSRVQCPPFFFSYQGQSLLILHVLLLMRHTGHGVPTLSGSPAVSCTITNPNTFSYYIFFFALSFREPMLARAAVPSL